MFTYFPMIRLEVQQNGNPLALVHNLKLCLTARYTLDPKGQGIRCQIFIEHQKTGYIQATSDYVCKGCSFVFLSFVITSLKNSKWLVAMWTTFNTININHGNIVIFSMPIVVAAITKCVCPPSHQYPIDLPQLLQYLYKIYFLLYFFLLMVV